MTKLTTRPFTAAFVTLSLGVLAYVLYHPSLAIELGAIVATAFVLGIIVTLSLTAMAVLQRIRSGRGEGRGGTAVTVGHDTLD